MAAPPKPWERPGVNHQNSSSLLDNAMSSGPQMGPAGAAGLGAVTPLPPTTASPPAPPPRPSTAPSRPMYGGHGGYSSMYGGGFGSPYSPGSLYSPYGGMGGYGSYGYNRFGMQGDYAGSTFARVAEENSRPAFQSIESIVQAVSSVSMMLDSSFQAVYSSFRAVIGVADNFSRLRSQMVQVFSALALIRTLRYLVRRLLELLRLRPAGQAEREWREAMAQAAGAAPVGGDGKPKKSAWPILMFFGIILGGPWLIWKLISSLSTSQEEESWMTGETDHVVAQAVYSFSGQGEEELSFSAGQQIILAPKELQPQVRGWLLGSAGGRKGLVPYNYIKVLGKRRGQQPQGPSSTAQPALPNQSLSSGFTQGPTSTTSTAQSTFPTQSLSSAFTQASLGGLPQSTDTADSGFGQQSAGFPVPDMDSIFGGVQQAGALPTSAGDGPRMHASVNQPSGDPTAADVLEKQTGE